LRPLIEQPVTLIGRRCGNEHATFQFLSETVSISGDCCRPLLERVCRAMPAAAERLLQNPVTSFPRRLRVPSTRMLPRNNLRIPLRMSEAVCKGHANVGAEPKMKGRRLGLRRAPWNRESSWRARLACVVFASLCMAGCGSSDPAGSSAERPATANQQKPAPTTTASSEKVPTADIEVKSPVRLKPIPARYTCDGADVSLPLSWSKVPPKTAEVDLFVLSALPINGKFVVAWAVAGINPHTHRLSSGRLPAGTVVGNNSSGQPRYSLCPPRGKEKQYAVLLFAVPRKIQVKRGFDAEALVEHTLVHLAAHEGETFLSYRRK
jgi:phosphatidylethanolamine-binding protein (PEBP) family uncharacterized protein